MNTAAGISKPRAMLAAAVLSVATPAATQEVKSLFAGADPSILAAEGRTWVYPTGGDRLAAWSSADGKTWEKGGPLITLEAIPWVKTDGAQRHFLWAPDMLAAKDRYYLYYSVGPQNPTPSRLGVATCATPGGPCIDSGTPLLTGGDGFEAIDPMVFVDPKTGGTYLYAGGSAGSTLRVYELAPDLTTIARRVVVDQPIAFTEGAFMHERGGLYYLSYSHGAWNDASYAVHYATAPSPTGPWTYRGAILRSDRTYKGPGHHSFFRDPESGAWSIVYHRWEGRTGNGPYKGQRRVAIQPIRYDAAGLIVPIKMTR